MKSVNEYARWSGIAPRRVRALLAGGELPGKRVDSHQWLVDDSAFSVRRRVGRPMSSHMAWALIASLSGIDPYKPVRADRLLAHRQRLAGAGLAAPPLLASWLRNRGERLRLRAHADDLADLLADERVFRSGVSHPRAGLSAGDSAEVWLRSFVSLDDFRGDYLLLDDPNGNVVVHRSEFMPVDADAPIGLVIADLADWNGPREDARVIELLASIL